METPQSPQQIILLPQSHNQQQGHPGFARSVPARIDAAMAYLSLMHRKTMTRAAVNDVSIEEIAGEQMTDGEKAAHGEACKLLASYFAGALEVNSWEEAEMDDYVASTEVNCQPDGAIIMCVGCNNGPDKGRCVICRGAGRILVTPVMEAKG